MTVSNQALLTKIDGVERRVEDANTKAADFRDRVVLEISGIRTQVALGEQAHKGIADKIDKVAISVESLRHESISNKGAENTWSKILDPILKILVALAIAYIVLKLQLK